MQSEPIRLWPRAIVYFNLSNSMRYATAFSRRDASEFCVSFTHLVGQRAQGKPGADCTHGSRAIKKHGIRTTGSTG